jgi:chemotaxis protein CheC
VGHRIDVGKLQLFNRISKEGSRRVAESLTQLTGLEAEIAVSKIHFLDLEDLKTHLGDATEVGIHVELTEPPHGYVLFLLQSADSKDLAAEIVPGEASDSDGFSDMECSALQQVGKITTSGYVDGWANVLETTIGMSTPTFTDGPASGIVREMGGWPDEDVVFVLDSRIVAGEADVDLTGVPFPLGCHRRLSMKLISSISTVNKPVRRCANLAARVLSQANNV